MGGEPFPAQNAVVTAGIGLLAWTLHRHVRSSPATVTIWTAACAVVVVVAASRLSVGWSGPSSTLASVLLGAFWDVVILAVVATRRPGAAAHGPSSAAEAEPPSTSADAVAHVDRDADGGTDDDVADVGGPPARVV